MWIPSSENWGIEELRNEGLEELIDFQFPFQLLFRFVITSTITMIIETKHQIPSNSISSIKLYQVSETLRGGRNHTQTAWADQIVALGQPPASCLAWRWASSPRHRMQSSLRFPRSGSAGSCCARSVTSSPRTSGQSLGGTLRAPMRLSTICL